MFIMNEPNLYLRWFKSYLSTNVGNIEILQYFAVFLNEMKP